MKETKTSTPTETETMSFESHLRNIAAGVQEFRDSAPAQGTAEFVACIARRHVGENGTPEGMEVVWLADPRQGTFPEELLRALCFSSPAVAAEAMRRATETVLAELQEIADCMGDSTYDEEEEVVAGYSAPATNEDK